MRLLFGCRPRENESVDAGQYIGRVLTNCRRWRLVQNYGRWINAWLLGWDGRFQARTTLKPMRISRKETKPFQLVPDHHGYLLAQISLLPLSQSYQRRCFSIF